MSNETENDELIVKGIEVKNDIIEELDVVFEADEDMELRLNEEEETRSEEKQEEQLEIRDAVFPLEFKSSKFSIESDNVTFDRKEQTAHSKNKSTFKSKNTIISSEGFNIYDNGNIINFYGNSVVILKWNFYYLF